MSKMRNTIYLESSFMLWLQHRDAFLRDTTATKSRLQLSADADEQFAWHILAVHAMYCKDSKCTGSADQRHQRSTRRRRRPRTPRAGARESSASGAAGSVFQFPSSTASAVASCFEELTPTSASPASFPSVFIKTDEMVNCPDVDIGSPELSHDKEKEWIGYQEDASPWGESTEDSSRKVVQDCSVPLKAMLTSVTELEVKLEEAGESASSSSGGPEYATDGSDSDISAVYFNEEDDPYYVPDSGDQILERVSSVPIVCRASGPSPVKQKREQPRSLGCTDAQEDSGTDSTDPRSNGESSAMPGISVLGTANGVKRIFDKPQYCPFCAKPMKKLSRHLACRLHKDETQVKQWLATEDEKEKEKQLTLMRNYGNYLHNCSVLRKGKGELIVVYRPVKYVDPGNYIPCQDCYGFYTKGDLWKHKCSQRPAENANGPSNEKKRKMLHCKPGKMLLPSTPEVGHRTHQILSKMSMDSPALLIHSDRLIKTYAEKLNTKRGPCKERTSMYIRQKTREVAKMILEYRAMTGETDAELADLICPQKFEAVTSATRSTAGFCAETNLYLSPSLALKLGKSLKMCGEILRGEALMSGDETLEKRCSAFLSLYSLHWEDRVSCFAQPKGDQMK